MENFTLIKENIENQVQLVLTLTFYFYLRNSRKQHHKLKWELKNLTFYLHLAESKTGIQRDNRLMFCAAIFYDVFNSHLFQ